MNKCYTRINWENEPSSETPLNDTNLNKIDIAVNEIDSRVVELANSSAQAYAKESESYAKGGTGTRAGEDTDNALYYKNLAAASQISAKASEDKAKEYRDEAFETTPQGYEEVVAKTNHTYIGLAELQILGWSVPSECPIQNEFSNGILTQKVGRVDLRSLTWRYSSGKNCFMHEKVIPAQTRNLYCTKYTEVATSRDLNNMEMSTTGWAGANELNIRDDSFNGDASAFKSASGGLYLYYELPTYKTYSVTNDKGINSDDLEFLGWSVPRECPIQNYKDKDGNFHQRVERVDLASLTWEIATRNRLYTTSLFGLIKMSASASSIANMFTTDLKTATPTQVYDNAMDNIIDVAHDSQTVHVYASAYVGNPSAFKSAMSGKYLYYELATEKIIPNGNERNQTVISDEWVSTKAYTVGQYAIYLNVLYKCIANNTNIIPTNATYWKRVTITGELMEIWSRLP